MGKLTIDSVFSREYDMILVTMMLSAILTLFWNSDFRHHVRSGRSPRLVRKQELMAAADRHFIRRHLPPSGGWTGSSEWSLSSCCWREGRGFSEYKVDSVAGCSSLSHEQSQAAQIWREFKKRRLAVFAAILMIVEIMIAVFAPFIANDRPMAFRGVNRFEFQQFIQTVESLMAMANGESRQESGAKKSLSSSGKGPVIAGDSLRRN